MSERPAQGDALPFFNNLQSLYPGRQPPFYEVGAVPGLDRLSADWQVIRDELGEVLADPPRADVALHKLGLLKVRGWRQIELRIYGVDYPARMRLFPRTMALLEGIEGLSTIYFSLLAPGARIPPHVGDTDAFYRIHLGLRIPASLPTCGIEVAGQQRTWVEGRCIVFNDIFCHSAWNDSSEERIVLILDVLRPEFRGRETYVNSGVRATLYHSRLYGLFWPVLELMPRILLRAGFPLLHYFLFRFHLLRTKWRQLA